MKQKICCNDPSRKPISVKFYIPIIVGSIHRSETRCTDKERTVKAATYTHEPTYPNSHDRVSPLTNLLRHHTSRRVRVDYEDERLGWWDAHDYFFGGDKDSSSYPWLFVWADFVDTFSWWMKLSVLELCGVASDYTRILNGWRWWGSCCCNWYDT